MSEIDPLIKRELQWMALGVLENRDLTTMVFQRVRRRRIRRALISLLTVLSLTGISVAGYAESLLGLISDYPITWEQSVGDYAAISKAAGLGDTLGGLTAQGLKVTWERCGSSQCPTQWVLSLKNQTSDIVTIAPSISVFIDHNPISSVTRPVTVIPGDTAILIFTFPEFKELNVRRDASWQWNWFLTSL